MKSTFLVNFSVFDGVLFWRVPKILDRIQCCPNSYLITKSESTFDTFTSIYTYGRFMHLDTFVSFDAFTSIQSFTSIYSLRSLKKLNSYYMFVPCTSTQDFTSIFSLRLFCHLGLFTSTQNFTSIYSLRIFEFFQYHFHIDLFTSI